MAAGKITTILGGIVGHALAVLCWLLLFTYFQVDALKWWVNLILPFGAVLLGMIGGLGFWLGARSMRQGSSGDLKLAAVIIAMLTAFAIRFCGYWTLEFDGMPVHRLIGFGTYLQETLGHARMTIGHTGDPIEIGAMGYVMEVVQTAAYALASFAFVKILPKPVTCRTCHTPMADAEAGSVLRNHSGEFRAFYEQLPPRATDRVAALRATPSEPDHAVGGAVKLQWRLWECSTCTAAALVESGEMFGGKYFQPVAALGQEILFDRRQAASPPPAPSPDTPPARPAFGRRVAG